MEEETSRTARITLIHSRDSIKAETGETLDSLIGIVARGKV